MSLGKINWKKVVNKYHRHLKTVNEQHVLDYWSYVGERSKVSRDTCRDLSKKYLTKQ